MTKITISWIWSLRSIMSLKKMLFISSLSTPFVARTSNTWFLLSWMQILSFPLIWYILPQHGNIWHHISLRHSFEIVHMPHLYFHILHACLARYLSKFSLLLSFDSYPFIILTTCFHFPSQFLHLTSIIVASRRT